MTLPQSPVSNLTLSSEGSLIGRKGVIPSFGGSYSDPFIIAAKWLRLSRIESFDISSVQSGYAFDCEIATDKNSVSISVKQPVGGAEQETQSTGNIQALIPGDVTGTIKQPYNFIGLVQSSDTYTPAFLTGSTSATSVVATWNAVTTGSVNIAIDGTLRQLTSLDFSGGGVTTMANVASVIQTALRALTSSTETVVWSTNHFGITSANTTSSSAITVTSAHGSGVDISGAGGTPFMKANVGFGVVTNAVNVPTATASASDFTMGDGMNPSYFSVIGVTGTFDTSHTVTGTNADASTFTFVPQVALLDLWNFGIIFSAIIAANSNTGQVLEPAINGAPITNQYATIGNNLLGTLNSDGWTQINIAYLAGGGFQTLSDGSDGSGISARFSCSGS